MIDAEVVDLFERRFAVPSIVLVRGIAAPVARRIERLANHQPPHVRVSHEDVMHPRV